MVHFASAEYDEATERFEKVLQIVGTLSFSSQVMNVFVFNVPCVYVSHKHLSLSSLKLAGSFPSRGGFVGARDLLPPFMVVA